LAKCCPKKVWLQPACTCTKTIHSMLSCLVCPFWHLICYNLLCHLLHNLLQFASTAVLHLNHHFWRRRQRWRRILIIVWIQDLNMRHDETSTVFELHWSCIQAPMV
jgi:hypothetical protein